MTPEPGCLQRDRRGCARCLIAADRGASRQPAGLRGSGVGILAGGGRLPLMIAENVVAHGGRVHIVGIEGEADARDRALPAYLGELGQVGRMVATLHAARRAGRSSSPARVRRPDLWQIQPDLGFFTSLPRIIGLMAGGDNSVLTSVVRFFESKGLAVRGAHRGGARSAGRSRRHRQRGAVGAGPRRCRLRLRGRAALGPLDAGQAVVVAHGQVLAIEGAEDTDAMLQSGGGLARPGGAGRARGVLAKGPKPRPGDARRHAGYRPAHRRCAPSTPDWQASRC